MSIYYFLSSGSLQTLDLEGKVPVVKSPNEKLAQLYPQAWGSVFFASYDSQGYIEAILAFLYTGRNMSNCPPLMSHRR
jgi:hypothetical protein